MYVQLWRALGSGDAAYHERGQDGFLETVQYLSAVEDHALVWTYSPWVLRKKWDIAMQIFTSTERTTALPADQVLEHLQSFAELPVSDLCQTFLEFLIHKRKTEVRV